jgi:hypothetical protein
MLTVYVALMLNYLLIAVVIEMFYAAGEREVSFGVMPSYSGASDSHLETVEADSDGGQLEFPVSRSRVKPNAGSFSTNR